MTFLNLVSDCYDRYNLEMELSSEVQAMLSELARRSKTSEFDYLERCIRGRYKAMAALEIH